MEKMWELREKYAPSSEHKKSSSAYKVGGMSASRKSMSMRDVPEGYEQGFTEGALCIMKEIKSLLSELKESLEDE